MNIKDLPGNVEELLYDRLPTTTGFNDVLLSLFLADSQVDDKPRRLVGHSDTAVCPKTLQKDLYS